MIIEIVSELFNSSCIKQDAPKEKAGQNEPPPTDRRQDIEIISKYFLKVLNCRYIADISGSDNAVGNQQATGLCAPPNFKENRATLPRLVHPHVMC